MSYFFVLWAHLLKSLIFTFWHSNTSGYIKKKQHQIPRDFLDVTKKLVNFWRIICFATTGLSRAWPCWLHGSLHSAGPKSCLPLYTAPSLCDGLPLLCWLCWGLTSHMVCTSSGPFACHWPPKSFRKCQCPGTPLGGSFRRILPPDRKSLLAFPLGSVVNNHGYQVP